MKRIRILVGKNVNKLCLARKMAKLSNNRLGPKTLDWTPTMKNENAQLAGALVGLGGTISQAMDEIDSFVPCGHPAAIVIDGLASLQAGLSDEELSAKTESVCGLINRVSEKRGVPVHSIANVSEFPSSKKELLDSLMDVASNLQPKEGVPQNINAWLYRGLAALEDDGDTAMNMLAEANVMKAAAALV